MQPLRGVKLIWSVWTLHWDGQPWGAREREALCSRHLCLLTSIRVYAKSCLKCPVLVLAEEQLLPGYKKGRSVWKRRSGILENTVFQSRSRARSCRPNGSFISEAQIFCADVIQLPKLTNILRTCNHRLGLVQWWMRKVLEEKCHVRIFIQILMLAHRVWCVFQKLKRIKICFWSYWILSTDVHVFRCLWLK